MRGGLGVSANRPKALVVWGRYAIGICVVIVGGLVWLHRLDPVADSEVDDALAFVASVQPESYESRACVVESECIIAIYGDSEPARDADQILDACSALDARCAFWTNITPQILPRLVAELPNDAMELVLERARAGSWLLEPEVDRLIAHSEVSVRLLKLLDETLALVQPPNVLQRVRRGAKSVMGFRGYDPSVPLRLWLVANHRLGLRLAEACEGDVVSCLIALDHARDEAAPSSIWRPLLGPRISRETAFFEVTRAMRAGASQAVFEHSYGYLRARALMVAIAIRLQRESSCRSLSEIVIAEDRLNAPGIGRAFTLLEVADGTVSVSLFGPAMTRAECPTPEPEASGDPVMWPCTSYGF